MCACSVWLECVFLGLECLPGLLGNPSSDASDCVMACVLGGSWTKSSYGSLHMTSVIGGEQATQGETQPGKVPELGITCWFVYEKFNFNLF